MSNVTPIRVTGSFTPSGTQDVNIISPIPLEVIIKSATSTITRVASSVTSILLIAANSSREGLLLYNDSSATQTIKFGTTASSTDFTVKLTPRMFYEVASPIYVGRIDVISSSTNGAIQVTELS